jgi:hypothetical protein
MHCPSLNIFGAFFPSWLLCALLGILATTLAYKVFSHLRLRAELRPALLLYPSITLSVTFALWLTFYGH